jgi:hypothetical protein
MYTKPKEEPMPDNQGQTRTAQQDAVARAVEASRHLRDAATEATTAAFEVAQETVLGMPGVQEVQEKVAAAAPVDWSKLMPQAGVPGNTNPLSEQWQNAVGGAFDADELVAAGKRVCLECVDSYEQAALSVIDLQERIADATNVDWMRSMASTRAGAQRDATKAYVSWVRGVLA